MPRHLFAYKAINSFGSLPGGLVIGHQCGFRNFFHGILRELPSPFWGGHTLSKDLRMILRIPSDQEIASIGWLELLFYMIFCYHWVGFHLWHNGWLRLSNLHPSQSPHQTLLGSLDRWGLDKNYTSIVLFMSESTAEASVAKVSVWLLLVRRNLSIYTNLKHLNNFCTSFMYASNLWFLAAYTPVSWFTTNWESQLMTRFCTPSIIVFFRPTIKALYSASLFEALKSS